VCSSDLGCLGKYTALATSADTGGVLKWDRSS
jgi:hypothetical protein